MSSETTHDQAQDSFDAAAHQGAVIVGLVAGQNPRVIQEAASYAKLFDSPLVGVFVDTARFVTFDDPTGTVQSAQLGLAVDADQVDIEGVVKEASTALEGSGVSCVVRGLVGDPAYAIRDLADELNAKLIVVGTRKPGIGDTLREWITGSVAARLAHRQNRSILVVPQGTVVADW